MHLDTAGIYRIDADRVRNSVRLTVQTGRAQLGRLWLSPGQCGDLRASGIAEVRQIGSSEVYSTAAAHEVNLSRTNEMVRQANAPGDVPGRILAPVHQMPAPHVVGPHAPGPIGLPHSGVVRVQ